MNVIDRARSWSGPGRAVVTLLTSVLLGLLAALLAYAMIGAPKTTYEASQVLGVVPTEQGSAEGAMAASKQWAAVGESPSFQQLVVGPVGVDAEALTSSLKVSSGEMAQVVSVTYKAADEAQARKVVQTVAARLTDVASRTDSRYPLKPLTDVGSLKKEGLSGQTVALGVFGAVLALGLALALYWLWASRRATRRAMPGE